MVSNWGYLLRLLLTFVLNFIGFALWRFYSHGTIWIAINIFWDVILALYAAFYFQNREPEEPFYIGIGVAFVAGFFLFGMGKYF
jgi:uncharacterized membrane protein YccC